MQLGYKKEDVQAVLIDCNMDVERSLAQLRQQYLPMGPPMLSLPLPHHLYTRGSSDGSAAFMNGEPQQLSGSQFAVSSQCTQQQQQAGRLIKQHTRNLVGRTMLPVGGRSMHTTQFQQQQMFGVGDPLVRVAFCSVCAFFLFF